MFVSSHCTTRRLVLFFFNVVDHQRHQEEEVRISLIFLLTYRSWQRLRDIWRIKVFLHVIKHQVLAIIQI